MYTPESRRGYVFKYTLETSIEENMSMSVIVCHCGLKVSHSQAKINKKFANYFLKTKANNKCFIVLNVKGYRKV